METILKVQTVKGELVSLIHKKLLQTNIKLGVWWLAYVIPALGAWGRGITKASLGYIMSSKLASDHVS